MANIKLLFYGCIESGFEETFIECFANTKNRIFISIENEENSFPSQFIALDKSTAIKFSKELRKQISILSENE